MLREISLSQKDKRSDSACLTYLEDENSEKENRIVGGGER